MDEPRIVATKQEQQLLSALVAMCVQYLTSSPGDPVILDHSCMSAGEAAIGLLVDYGLVEPFGRGGTWTEAGKLFLGKLG